MSKTCKPSDVPTSRGQLVPIPPPPAGEGCIMHRASQLICCRKIRNPLFNQIYPFRSPPRLDTAYRKRPKKPLIACYQWLLHSVLHTRQLTLISDSKAVRFAFFSPLQWRRQPIFSKGGGRCYEKLFCQGERGATPLSITTYAAQGGRGAG